MKHVKLLLALIVVLLAGLAAGEMAMAQGKKKSTSKIPVKTERPAAKRTPQPKQEKKPAAKPRQEKKRDADENPRKVVERKPQPKPEPKPQPKAEPKAEPALSNRTFTANGVSFTMVAVEGGTFTMGATSEQGGDADDDERPTHQVTLSSYYIGETEVTQELWEAVMGSNPSRFKGSNRPVECVSWDDCQEFLSRLNRITGERFRLPTEAEWEYAARGGSRSRGYKYSGSDNIYDVAWFEKNSNNESHPVATKLPNELGLYDMSGNVSEWCSDSYGSYSSSSQTNPTGPKSGSYRVGRGSSWDCSAEHCRLSLRTGDLPVISFNDCGLRLALSIQ